MYNINPPNFPEYIDDTHTHLSSIRLPAFTGTQIRNGPYGAISEPGYSNGDTHAVANKSIDPEVFQAAVAWVIKHSVEIRPRLFEVLVDRYWEMRDLVIESLIDEDPNKVVPEIENSEDLASLSGLVALHIGGMSSSGEPIFGIELGCNWEEEHGAGVQFEGLRVVESGDASIAFCFGDD